MASQVSPDGLGKGSGTRGRFPRNPIDEAIELVETVFRLGQGESVRRTSALSEMGRSPKSSASSTLITSAIRGYGLLDRARGGKFLEVTDLGLALINAKSDIEKRSLAWNSMISNDIFQSFVDRYADRPLPSDTVVIDVFMASFDLNGADAKTCFNVFIQNLTQFGLIEEEGGTRVITPPISGSDTESSLAEIDADDSKSEQIASNAQPYQDGNGGPTLEIPSSALVSTGAAANVGREIQPQIAFNVQIQLPENASPDTYEAIFRNIAVHLLGRPEE